MAAAVVVERKTSGGDGFVQLRQLGESRPLVEPYKPFLTDITRGVDAFVLTPVLMAAPFLSRNQMGPMDML